MYWRLKPRFELTAKYVQNIKDFLSNKKTLLYSHMSFEKAKLGIFFRAGPMTWIGDGFANGIASFFECMLSAFQRRSERRRILSSHREILC